MVLGQDPALLLIQGQHAQGDFPAGKMIRNVPGIPAERVERLMKVLDVNPEWRMHQVSDGQRRRVQLCLGLLRPFQVRLFLGRCCICAGESTTSPALQAHNGSLSCCTRQKISPGGTGLACSVILGLGHLNGCLLTVGKGIAWMRKAFCMQKVLVQCFACGW